MGISNPEIFEEYLSPPLEIAIIIFSTIVIILTIIFSFIIKKDDCCDSKKNRFCLTFTRTSNIIFISALLLYLINISIFFLVDAH